jgi:hypothetical protein
MLKYQYSIMDTLISFFCATKENNISVVYPKGTKNRKQLGWNWEKI